MNREIRILMLEDVGAGSELVEQELSRAQVNFSSKHVETREDYLRELVTFAPDVILADSNLSQFNSHEARRLLEERNFDIPIVLVNSSIPDELAIESLNEGVDDDILKCSLKQLPAVVLNALKKKELEQKKEKTETALRRKEDQYRLIAENTSDLICLVDRNGNFIYVSPSVQEVLGYRPEELIGRDFFSLIHPDDEEAVRTVFRESSLFKNRQTTEYRSQRKGGEWRSLESASSWVFDERGKPQRAVIVSRDLTDRKRLEEQLRHSQKMEAVGNLAGGLAHDFNNLLTAIIGFTDILLTHTNNPEKVRKDAEEIKKAGERAAALTRQLLAFSRKQVLQPKVLDLNAAVANIHKMMRRLIGEDIDFVVHTKPDLGAVRADPGQIEQVIVNLIINARDAMPRGGKLTLETSHVELDDTFPSQPINLMPGNYVVLAVSDTGCGMDAETQSHLFEPFFTTKEQGKGTGLGLSTVYGIVKQSGGAISVESELGSGTSFKIYLPRIGEVVTAGEVAKGSMELARGSETILLVEDEEMVRSLVRNVLEKNGYKVLEAANGWDALRNIKEYNGEIHLVMTDLVMPQMGGRELVQRLACLRTRTKVLYMTGYTDDSAEHRGASDVDTAFIQKPFTPATLTRKVREVLEKKRKAGMAGSG